MSHVYKTPEAKNRVIGVQRDRPPASLSTYLTKLWTYYEPPEERGSLALSAIEHSFWEARRHVNGNPHELLTPCGSGPRAEPSSPEPWGVGGPSLRGGIRSLILSKPLASSKLVILWWGEKPASAEIF